MEAQQQITQPTIDQQPSSSATTTTDQKETFGARVAALADKVADQQLNDFYSRMHVIIEEDAASGLDHSLFVFEAEIPGKVARKVPKLQPRCVRRAVDMLRGDGLRVEYSTNPDGTFDTLDVCWTKKDPMTDKKVAQARLDAVKSTRAVLSELVNAMPLLSKEDTLVEGHILVPICRVMGESAEATYLRNIVDAVIAATVTNKVFVFEALIDCQ